MDTVQPRSRPAGRRLRACLHIYKNRVVPRLNLTLDRDTAARLDAHASRAGVRRAAVARTLLREALDRREVAERRRKLAADYAAERGSARELLRDLERGELDLLD